MDCEFSLIRILSPFFYQKSLPLPSASMAMRTYLTEETSTNPLRLGQKGIWKGFRELSGRHEP